MAASTWLISVKNRQFHGAPLLVYRAVLFGCMSSSFFLTLSPLPVTLRLSYQIKPKANLVFFKYAIEPHFGPLLISVHSKASPLGIKLQPLDLGKVLLLVLFYKLILPPLWCPIQVLLLSRIMGMKTSESGSQPKYWTEF